MMGDDARSQVSSSDAIHLVVPEYTGLTTRKAKYLWQDTAVFEPKVQYAGIKYPLIYLLFIKSASKIDISTADHG